MASARSRQSRSAPASTRRRERSLRQLLRRVDPHVWDALLAFVVTAAAFVFVVRDPRRARLATTWTPPASSCCSR